jgi:hypothetical protein
MDTVVDGIEGLTADWLAGALGLPVTGVTIEEIGTGQIGRSFRLSLRYASAVPGAPRTLVAKLAGGDGDARRRVAQGYRKEVGFYTELAATVNIRTPGCWYGAISDDATSFVLLLEDLAPRQPGMQVDACTPARAAAALRNLAGLHAPRWNDERLRAHAFLSPIEGAGARFLGDIYRQAADGFVDRYGDRLDAGDVQTVRAVGDAIVAWLLARPAPFAVVHGDYRLDNLMFSSSDDDVVALDWQTVTLAPPLRDVAYFLGTALEIDVRRDQERPLVMAYHEALLGRGVVDYSFDACFEDYRAGHLQGPFITVVGAIYATATPSATSDDMFLSMTRRSCAAVRDLGSLDLV